MMFGSNVAPRRRVIDKKFVPWMCKCVVTHERDECDGKGWQVVSEEPLMNPGYLTRCIDCGWAREK